MKFPFSLLFLLFLNGSFLYAIPNEDVLPYINYETKEVEAPPIYSCGGIFDCDSPDDNDPFEAFNRIIFDINLGIDYILIEPISWAYKEVMPEFMRIRISYVLRNLNEPIILANNLLQGELEEGRNTLWRFIFNSTLGVAGLFDVSTDLGIPYKKQDLGLTFASWGVDPGPYLILPILGPSTIRDAFGRLGDFAFDPVNWFTYGIQSTSKTGVQILDAKTDTIEIADDIKKNAIDHYASIQAWYTERRNALATAAEDRQALDTPRPEEAEAEEEAQGTIGFIPEDASD